MYQTYQKQYQLYFDRYRLLKRYLTSPYSNFFNLHIYEQLFIEEEINSINYQYNNTISNEALIVKHVDCSDLSTEMTFIFTDIEDKFIEQVNCVIDKIKEFRFIPRYPIGGAHMYNLADIYFHISIFNGVHVMCYSSQYLSRSLTQLTRHQLYRDMPVDTYRDICKLLKSIPGIYNINILPTLTELKKHTNYLNYKSSVPVLNNIINNVFQIKDTKEVLYYKDIPVNNTHIYMKKNRC